MNVMIAAGMFGIFVGGTLVGSCKYMSRWIEGLVRLVAGLAFTMIGIYYVFCGLPQN